MALAFGFDQAALARSVIELIEQGRMLARVDKERGILVKRDKEVRGEAFRNALVEGEKLQRSIVASQFRRVGSGSDPSTPTDGARCPQTQAYEGRHPRQGWQRKQWPERPLLDDVVVSSSPQNVPPVPPRQLSLAGPISLNKPVSQFIPIDSIPCRSLERPSRTLLLPRWSAGLLRGSPGF